VIDWAKKDAALIGSVALANGQRGNIVLLADAQNPKGAVCLMPGPQGGAPVAASLDQVGALIAPGDWVSILCMQERAFGTRGWPGPPKMEQ